MFWYRKIHARYHIESKPLKELSGAGWGWGGAGVGAEEGGDPEAGGVLWLGVGGGK